MNFLAPLFMLGAAAVALPIIFHLIRRRTREKQPFSSLLFLEASPPRLTKKSRLEHWLLLLLRSLVLILLALAFARPFTRDQNSPVLEGSAATLNLVLVDTSASMRRGGLMEDALERLEMVLKEGDAPGRFAVGTFDRGAQLVMGFDEWDAAPADQRVALALDRMAAVSPGWNGTALDEAFIEAAEIIEDHRAKAEAVTDRNAPGNVIIISDMQEGSELDRLAGFEWPANAGVRLEPVGRNRTFNAGVYPVVTQIENSATDYDHVRVRVSNSGDSQNEVFQLGWTETGGAFAGDPVEVYLPPGQSRIVKLAVPTNGVASGRVLLRGDAEPFDNIGYVVPETRNRKTVVYLGNEEPGDIRGLRFYVENAFAASVQAVVSVVANPEPGDPDARDAALVIASSEFNDAARLRGFLEAGKTVLLTVRSPDHQAMLQQLLPETPPGVDVGPDRNYSLLARIAHEHPLFAPFREGAFGDFTKINIWNYRRLSVPDLEDEQVLARFDTGDPALITLPVADGRLFLMATSWSPDDSQLATSSRFIPLLYSFLEIDQPAGPDWTALTAGQRLHLDEAARAGFVSLSKVGGEDVTVPALDAGIELAEPGIYELRLAGETNRFAVNLDPAESRTGLLEEERLVQAGVPVNLEVASRQADATASQRRQLDSETEQQQKYWRWLLVAAGVLLLFETLLAGYQSRQPAPAGA